MARLTGLLKIEGTLENMTFYKTQDGHLVKTKGGVSGARIANDDAFIRTRENGSEFGSSASAGKLFRDTLRPLMLNAADNRVTSRVTQLMSNIKSFDKVATRGNRTVAGAVADAEAKALLKGFNFNINSVLASVLYKPLAIDAAANTISIAGLIPVNDVAFPTGATHLTIKSGIARIDFAAGTSELQLSNVVNLPIDATATDVRLAPLVAPTLVGLSVLLLSIEFFQDINGVQYSLKNGAYNALTVVDAA